MHDSLLKSALKLSKAQRILLVEQIWDSLVEEDDAPDLTPEQEAELDRRIARYERTGPKGTDWATAKKRILRRARRS